MLSRAQRDEGMKQIKEIRRRLRENDWDEVDVLVGIGLEINLEKENPPEMEFPEDP